MVNSFNVIEYLNNKSILDYYVFISATSVFDSEYSRPTNVLNWSSIAAYHSLDEGNQSLRIDFPITDIYIEKFSIKSAINRDPLNWVFEGSTDAINFITLHQNENTSLCSEWGYFDPDNTTTGCLGYESKEYPVTQHGFYKSLRIRQTGLDSNGQNYLVFSGLEIYGHIKILSYSCNTSSFLIFNLLRLLFTAIIL